MGTAASAASAKHDTDDTPIGPTGGGVAGLGAAWRAVERGASVALLEARERVGGLVWTERTDGFVIERGPESFLTRDPILLELSEALGLTDRLVKTNAQGAFVVHRGRLEKIPAGFQLLAPLNAGAFWRSTLVSRRGKLRALFEESFDADGSGCVLGS